MVRYLVAVSLGCAATAQQIPSSLENMQKLIESSKPLASALLKIKVRDDLRTAVQLSIPETPAGEALRIGAKRVNPEHVLWRRHFEASELRPWVDIVEFETSDAAAEAFKDARQQHSGLLGHGLFLFLTSGAAATRNAACAVVQRERWLFSVCSAVPFAIDFDRNSPAERREIANLIDLTSRTLESVVRQAVDPKAQPIYRPRHPLPMMCECSAPVSPGCGARYARVLFS